MFAIVWQFWWSAWDMALAIIFSIGLICFAVSGLNKSYARENRQDVIAGVLIIILCVVLIFLVFGTKPVEDQLDDQATQQETRQGIAHAFEASGHEVTGVYINLVKPSDGITMRISNSCGEWEYELLDNYSESDLRVDPVSVQRIEQGHQADSREFCPPPHEEWLLLLD